MNSVRVSKLPNGVQVATDAMPDRETAAVGIWAAAGSRHEPARLGGAAHFLEHLLFKGTRKRSARRISEEIEGVGGYLNGFTAEELTCYHAQGPAAHARRMLAVLGDMYRNARLAAAEVARERGVILEEIRSVRDQPAQRVQELLDETMWPGHVLGRPVAGTERSVGGITRTQLRAFRRRAYSAGTTLVTGAGRVAHGELVRWAGEELGGLRRAPRPLWRPASGGSGPRVAVEVRDAEQAHMVVALRGFSRHDPRRYAVRLLNVVLGENASSRLFQEIRERRGLAYSVGSGTEAFEDTGALHISAGMDPDKAVVVLRLIVRQMRRLAERGITAAELRRARDFAMGSMQMGLEGTANRMNWLGESLAGYGRVVAPAEFADGWRAVTAQQIRAVAAALCRRNRAHVALVAPAVDKKELHAELAGLD